MKKAFLFVATAITSIGLMSCEKCYECTKKCGTCTLLTATVAGCQGDSSLQGQSIEAWKAYLESQGFACAYNNDVQEACGDDNKSTLTAQSYTCLSK